MDCQGASDKEDNNTDQSVSDSKPRGNQRAADETGKLSPVEGYGKK